MLDDAPSTHPEWVHAHPVPTTLVALCPDDEPPTVDSVRNTVRALLGDDFVDLGAIEPTPGACLWSLAVGVRGTNRRILLWAEVARDLDPAEVDDPRAHACRFAILLETMLEPDECVDDLTRSMRLLVALVPDCPALLDLRSRIWHLRESLDREFLAEDSDPPDWAIWTVSAAAAEADGPHWISTCGLARCGRPELEMLNVPASQVRTAVAMLNDLAGLLLEERTPDPGAPWSVGPEITVTLRPWREVAAQLPADAPGSLASRRLPADVEATAGPDHPFAGVRAVVCDRPDRATMDDDEGTPASGDCACAWPAAVAEEIEAGGVVMYRSHRATQRELRLAQRSFPELAACFARLCRDGADPEGESTPAFFLKAGMPLGPNVEDGSEHLWFRLLHLDGLRLVGRLMHPPTIIDVVQEGELAELSADSVSSWQVICDGVLYTPENAKAMVAAIEAHRRGTIDSNDH